MDFAVRHSGFTMLRLRSIQMKLAGAALLLLVTSVGMAQGIGDGQDAGPENEPEASLFRVVEDRTRELSDDERRLVFRLLREARNVPIEERREVARKFVLGRRNTMPEFADRSDSEFLVEDLLRATRLYRGQLVTIEGFVRSGSVEKLHAGSNRFDVADYHRLRVYVEEGDSSPVEIYFLDLPDNWPTAGDVIDDVSVVGRFLKLVEYDDKQTGRPAYAPVIVAERVEYQPKIQAGQVAINPLLWDGVVRHKKRDWTNAERDLYYRVLAHARDGDYGDQKQQAKKNLRARIERFRAEAESEHDRRTARAKRYLKTHPEGQAEYQRQLDDADRKKRRKLTMYLRYRNTPTLFPTYADIVINDHIAYNGQLMTLRGRVRQITKSPADEKIRYDLGTLYEVWFYTEDSQAHPTVAICTSLPPDLLNKAREEGERLDETVSVTGYFFKMYGYEAQDTIQIKNKIRFAPMLLARQIEWRPPPSERKLLSAIYVLPFIAALVVGMIYVLWRIKREDRQFRRQLSMGTETVTMHDLSQIEGLAGVRESSFDQIEVVEEMHFRDHGDRDPEEEPSANDAGTE